MAEATKKSFPIAGVAFLAVAVYEFLSGDDWIVWFTLGILFGGLSVFGSKKSGNEA